MRALSRVLGAIAATVFAASTAQATVVNLVTNGGFETGSFSGWTPVGNTVFNGVQCPGPSAAVVEGNCSAFFGPVGSTGGITQTLNSLIVGARYLIDFSVQADGGIPGSFSALFGGNTLVSLVNPPVGPYQHYQFTVNATSSSQSLAFNFRDDPGFMSLDAVSVVIPEPTTLALVGASLIGLGVSRRRRSHR